MRMTDRENQTKHSQPRFAAWLAIAFVCFFQLGVTAHEATHASDDLDHVCDVCVQFDNAVAIAADFVSAQPNGTYCVAEISIVDEPVESRFDHSYPCRAPPSS